MNSPTEPSDEEIAANVRARSGLSASAGPSDQQIVDGVRGFAREFQYWYNRVLAEAVPKYQNIIIDRINPMIRGMQLEGLDTKAVASRLVADYAHRNYVTAGGWALEQLAIAASPRLQKSTAVGIDAEWHEPGPPPVAHLYVIKSGTVTRNSDILKALKTHGQDAQKRLLQTNKKAIVRVYYVVTAGQRSSTFHDGVYRPSSAEFWAQTFDLEDDEEQAIDLALAMAQEAGSLLRGISDDAPLRALEAAVAAYIATEDDSSIVDWEFLAKRNMIDDEDVKAEAKTRHDRARKAAADAGYEWPKRGGQRGSSKQDQVADGLAEAAAALTPEMREDLSQILPSEPDAS
ncbi:hypothetical protein DE4585_02846 [Mycobacteroides salmoniphilum]|uniref:Type II restriction endonuclease EcoO109IR domain-containing protein n=1 Tax=Mycobacteroides salmoniphilum TaxID=404941 RepID=A0A4R8RX19_9MYCO|nr:PmeII family type II restriction endonuclease [Mycobacteroides salmoniphilum]TDZ79111.1 hypothetical protein DE4585_02846 [Mycobacteroides salmoniphilum]